MSVTSPAPTAGSEITGSLWALMNALSAAQEGVAASPIIAELEPLTTYRWKHGGMDFPALYNWLLDEPSIQKDTARREDSFVIETRLGVAVGQDEEERLIAMELYHDAYRSVMDPIFRDEVGGRQVPLLSGTAHWAERQRAASFSENFGGVDVVGIAFTQRFDVSRIVTPA